MKLTRKEKPLSLRRQLSRLITLCCLAAVCIQAAVMVSIIIRQYVRQEREDTLYLLKSDNVRMDSNIQYVEETALAVQHHSGLTTFFEGGEYDREEVKSQLENAADLFSERNRLESSEPFVERIYLFNMESEMIYQNYYPAAAAEIAAEGRSYRMMYRKFTEMDRNFFCNVMYDRVNLCMWLYNGSMEPMGVCIFGLNRFGIEQTYQNLKEMKRYVWSIRQDGNLILSNKEESGLKETYALEDTVRTGFGLTIYAGVSEWFIFHSLWTTIFMILLISAVVIFLLSYAAHRVAVHYVQPLETVADKIRQVGKGNFDTRLGEYEAEELQHISTTFNEMTEYIRRLVKEVYETQLTAQEAQIQYLQAQMNPHFLFNVLSMIEMKAAFNQDREVQDMLYKLSRLYQGKIFRRNEYFIRLEEEMEIVEFYLSIQNSRFGEKITYSIEYTGRNENYGRYLVPRLCIEPVVENAVSHGLEPKEGNGHIFIEISDFEECLFIYIEDNGVGFDPKMQEQREDRSHSHVGLWNTDKMIHNLCGEEYGLQISSRPGIGTIVRVKLPVKYGDDICGK